MCTSAPLDTTFSGNHTLPASSVAERSERHANFHQGVQGRHPEPKAESPSEPKLRSHEILIPKMDTDCIAELLTPFFETPAAESETLSARQLDQISIYIDLLLRWNARINLTAVRDPEEIVTRHFGESLFAARHFLPCGAGTPARVGPAIEGPSKTGMTDVLPVELYAEDRDQQNVPQNSIPDADQSGTPPVAPNSKQLGRVVDLGSGAGFPGLPIKIWSPHTPVTLIESNQKKVAFLREVIRALTLTDINVFP